MIPAQAVEAAAIVHCNRGDSDWRDWTEDAKAEARQDMRAALEAAAPHMLAGAWKAGFWKGTEWVSSAGEDGSEDARFNNPHDGSTP